MTTVKEENKNITKRKDTVIYCARCGSHMADGYFGNADIDIDFKCSRCTRVVRFMNGKAAEIRKRPRNKSGILVLKI